MPRVKKGLARVWEALAGREWGDEPDKWEKEAFWIAEHPKLHGGVQVFLGAVFLVLNSGVVERWGANLTLVVALAFACAALIELMYLLAYGWPPFALKNARNLGLVKANLYDLPKAIAGGVAFLAWGIAGISCVYLDWFVLPWISTPVSATGIWLSLGLLVCHRWKGTYLESESVAFPYWRRRRRRLSRHYLVMSVCVLVTSFAPLFGLVPTYRLYADAAVLGPVLGSLMIIGGILDQRVLSQLQGQVPGSREDER